MASGWLPFVLAVDFQSSETDRAEADSAPSARVDLPHGERESDVGSAAQRPKLWLAFLRNHREAVAAMDFFTVPTLRFGILYCFFVIRHDRRQILHLNVTKHPTSLWVVQQLREAFPFESAPRFLIFDCNGKYGVEVPEAIRSLRIRPVRTSFESPWQNGVAERWVESCRRDLLDHIIAVNERHLKRLLSEYVCYYHKDRTHLGLGKGTPQGRTRSPGLG